MPWIQLTLETTKSENEKVEQALLDAGALSVTFRDAEDDPVLEPAPGETPLWNKIIVTGMFEADINMECLKDDILHALGNEVQLHIDALEDKDWVRAWMDNYQPMQFGNRLWVCPKHLSPPQPSAVNLMLDPGLAFGTGTHPTTALCLKWLDAIDVQGKRILDYGCGSGVLAIASLLLGAEHCDGVDIDPQALEASVDNAITNHVEQSLGVFLPEQLPENVYDIVIANILAGPLVELAATLAAYTKPGGQIVLSGILTTQADAILQAYKPWFELEAPVMKEDWIRISGIKR